MKGLRDLAFRMSAWGCVPTARASFASRSTPLIPPMRSSVPRASGCSFASNIFRCRGPGSLHGDAGSSTSIVYPLGKPSLRIGELAATTTPLATFPHSIMTTE